MKTMALAFVLFCFGLLPVSAAFAQDNGDAGLQKRLELAREMHKVKPLDAEIEGSIQQLSMRYPEDKRELFVRKMLEVFDQNTLTEISVKAMADTFTEAELKKMIDYYSSPEGKAIGEKMPIYLGLVEPELRKRIDQALMELRTGKASD